MKQDRRGVLLLRKKKLTKVAGVTDSHHLLLDLFRKGEEGTREQDISAFVASQNL